MRQWDRENSWDQSIENDYKIYLLLVFLISILKVSSRDWSWWVHRRFINLLIWMLWLGDLLIRWMYFGQIDEVIGLSIILFFIRSRKFRGDGLMIIFFHRGFILLLAFRKLLACCLCSWVRYWGRMAHLYGILDLIACVKGWSLLLWRFLVKNWRSQERERMFGSLIWFERIEPGF